MTPPERLEEAARLLYPGHELGRWKKPLARDLGIVPKTLGRWMSGETPLAMTHGVFAQTAALLRARAREFVDMARELER